MVYLDCDENLAVLQNEAGILALQTYKWRGRVQGAQFFNTAAGGTHPLTLALAEEFIEET